MDIKKLIIFVSIVLSFGFFTGKRLKYALATDKSGDTRILVTVTRIVPKN